MMKSLNGGQAVTTEENSTGNCIQGIHNSAKPD